MWIEPARENAALILNVLDQFGFGSLVLAVEDFLEPGNVTANVIGFDDLIANKRASGRLRDLADIEDLGAE